MEKATTFNGICIPYGAVIEAKYHPIWDDYEIVTELFLVFHPNTFYTGVGERIIYNNGICLPAINLRTGNMGLLDKSVEITKIYGPLLSNFGDYLKTIPWYDPRKSPNTMTVHGNNEGNETDDENI